MTREEMDALVEGHYRAEVAGDIGAIGRESAWLDVAGLQHQLGVGDAG